MEELWCSADNRISVRFEYKWRVQVHRALVGQLLC